MEGRDYAPLTDPRLQPSRVDRLAPPLSWCRGAASRRASGCAASWFHPMVVHDGQITVCMAEPALYEIYEHETRLLAERLHPRRVLLNMDEIRMGGTCQACGAEHGRTAGECITRQVQIIRRHIRAPASSSGRTCSIPGTTRTVITTWSTETTQALETCAKDLTMAVWGGKPRPASLRFFAEEAFAAWWPATTTRTIWTQSKAGWSWPGRRRGERLHVHPWQRKYALLGDFGDLLKGP